MSGGKDGLRGLLALRARMSGPVLAAAVLAGALALPASAFATSAQTWVAYYGGNSGACLISSPCASFAYALSQTSAGGEVDALTSGSYGAVTISQPVTINGTGTNATINFTSGDGVNVELPGPGLVRLVGLDIDGGGLGTFAVNDQAGTVELEDAQLSGFTQFGVRLGDATQTASENTVTVTNSTINGGEVGVRTIQSSPAGAPGQVTLNHDTIENASQAAVFTRISDQVTVDNTLLSNSQVGYMADTSPYRATFNNDEVVNESGAAFQLYTTTTAAQLSVSNSQIAYNAGAGLANVGTTGSVTFTSDQIEGNGAAGLELGGTTATLDGDSISANVGAGVSGGTGSLTADVIDGNANGIVNTGGTMTISGSTIDGNTGNGVQANGTSAIDVLSGDTVSQNGTGLMAENGGTIVSLGANNSIYGNTINGSPTSNVTTGAVGPVGPAGVAGSSGTNGKNGTQGATGAVGPAGPAGAVGRPGAAGQIEIVTCTTVKKKVKKSKKTVTQKKCTTKLASSPVSFKASAASARISRAGHVDASGSLRGGKLTLHTSKALRAGRYRLTLTTEIGGHRRTSTETIALT